jgi:16S rRNA G966 N2-methylase RsmD
MDIRRALSFLERKGHRFEIVFADPPYGAGWPAILGELLFPRSGGILVPSGVVVIEHSIREPLPPGENYRIIDRREYGETVLSFLAPSVVLADTPGERGEET